MVVVHHGPPPVAMRVIRSPSLTPLSRKAATAFLARWALSAVMCRLSKTITYVRPAEGEASRLVASRGRRAGSIAVAAGDAVNRIESKVAMGRTFPSSVTVKSSLVRPGTGFPALSLTTTSTVTSSTPRGNVGVGRAAGGSWAKREDETRYVGATTATSNPKNFRFIS
jgi:hypothetical protein